MIWDANGSCGSCCIVSEPSPTTQRNPRHPFGRVFSLELVQWWFAPPPVWWLSPNLEKSHQRIAKVKGIKHGWKTTSWTRKTSINIEQKSEQSLKNWGTLKTAVRSWLKINITGKIEKNVKENHQNHWSKRLQVSLCSQVQQQLLPLRSSQRLPRHALRHRRQQLLLPHRTAHRGEHVGRGRRPGGPAEFLQGLKAIQF